MESTSRHHEAAPRASSSRLLRLPLLSGALGLLLAVVESAALHLRPVQPFATGATALHFFLVSWGAVASLTLLVALLATGVVGAAARLRRFRVAELLPGLAGAAVLAGAALALSVGLAARQPLFVALLVVAVGGGGFLLLWLPVRLGGSRWRRPVAGLLVALAMAFYLLDCTQLRGLYFNQHVTLGLLQLGLALTGARLWGWPQMGPSPVLRVGSGLLLAGSGFALAVLWTVPGDAVSQTVRYASFSGSTATREALFLLERLTDLDGDGYANVLGESDCAPWDGAINPGAAEVAGDGIDQNCLAGDPEPGPPPLPPRPVAAGTRPVRNLLLITVDALRRDHFEGPLAPPFFGRLAERGFYFGRAWGLYPGTVPALYGLVTSRYPSSLVLEERNGMEYPAADSTPTVFELAAADGISSYGSLCHRSLAPALGISRGMREVWAPHGDGKGVFSAQSTAEALRMVSALMPDERFLLWVHYYDPHAPYVAAPGEPAPASPAAAYRQEVERTAGEVERLLAALEEAGRLADTAVVLTADHGEELEDHGNLYHGQTLYEESLRVPLLLLLPGMMTGTEAGGAGGVRWSGPVSQIDLAPTLLELLGLAHRQPESWRGRSLVPWLVHGPAGAGSDAPEPIFVELFQRGGRFRSYGVVAWPWKLIHVTADHFLELYNLEEDPGERRNLYDVRPDIAAPLAALLDRHRGSL